MGKYVQHLLDLAERYIAEGDDERWELWVKPLEFTTMPGSYYTPPKWVLSEIYPTERRALSAGDSALATGGFEILIKRHNDPWPEEVD